MREQSARAIRKQVYGDLALDKKYSGGWMRNLVTSKVKYDSVKAIGLRAAYQAAKKVAKSKPEIAVAAVVLAALLKRRKAVKASKERADRKKAAA